MTMEAQVTLRWPVVIVAAGALVMLGAVGSYLVTRETSVEPAMPARESPPVTPPAADVRHGDDTPLPDVVITLSEGAVTRAGIVVAAVESGSAANVLRLPAVVEPNAYKQVSVTPLLPGRVTSVLADLGDAVQAGQTMAAIFSPELAEAQTRFMSARAELDAHEQELARTEKLFQIGASSRQELERVHAEHTAQRTGVDSARARLTLLGLTREAIDGLAAGSPVEATVDVPAPIAGVVTERLANAGLNVDPSTRLFTVVDLSTVWIVASLYERDFARVRLGDRATVVTAAYPDVRLPGRVSYLDPQVNAGSRTAKIRVEVSNPRRELRLGMLAEVQIEESKGTAVATIPESAVQHISNRSFVYIRQKDGQAQFIEREVRLGESNGERVQVVAGVVPGDQVVVGGSFFLRAERERLGLRSPGSAPTAHVH